MLLDNDSAGVWSFLEQREGLYFLEGAKVDIPLDAKVLAALFASFEDGFGVCIGTLVAEFVAQVSGELAGFCAPLLLCVAFPVFLILLFAHCAVHVNIVQRGRYGHRPSVGGKDASAYRGFDVLLLGGTEQADYPFVHGIGGLNLYDPSHNHYPQHHKQQGQEEHHHVDSVAVFDVVLYFTLPFAHFFFIIVAGSEGRAAFEPSSPSLISAADAL